MPLFAGKVDAKMPLFTGKVDAKLPLFAGKQKKLAFNFRKILPMI